MLERDIVLAKVATIDRCLARIADVRGNPTRSLLPIDLEEITVLNLTRATQAAIDLATHVVASEGFGLPDSVAGAFALLEKNGVIDAELSGRLRRMVGFRNIAVHDYQTLDPQVVDAIVERHLGDLRGFAARIAARLVGPA
jgi:uncharacterized protein YutE (UPF0331/DUF86 family)